MDDEAVRAAARAIAEREEGRPDEWEWYDDLAESALSAYHEWLKANGRVIVPVEPTEAMVEAGVRGYLSAYDRRAIAADQYRAMIAAAQGGE